MLITITKQRSWGVPWRKLIPLEKCKTWIKIFRVQLFRWAAFYFYQNYPLRKNLKMMSFLTFFELICNVEWRELLVFLKISPYNIFFRKNNKEKINLGSSYWTLEEISWSRDVSRKTGNKWNKLRTNNKNLKFNKLSLIKNFPQQK